ncbi:hypothetical protein QTO34_015357 [Cnephaeus nilssonii]|uniref:G-protein coupled receptors family 1 profile domain-containing protein n=1 Tax=Cnephaeus nilssonii TaxID=3371016 RepID=A0AA40I4P6_CNENI|nr:hypothetical protein QTO34_015357 [Eptesicus nilssonii]
MSALVCITNHPGKDLDLHRESFLSEFPCSHLHHMELRNVTGFSEFLLLGFSEEPALQPLIFGLFLCMYLITVLGNLLIILAVSSDSHLHTPMYFFLSNLSLVDICFTSTTVPKMLWNIQKQNRAITYGGCITQMYFFLLFAGLDNFLLTVMAYDRFVAICHPLHYMVIMNPRLCGLLVLGSWIMSVLHSLLQCLVVLRLTFCPDLEIPHFFCEIKQMVQLACSDTFLNTMVMYFGIVLLGGGPLVGILYSYSKIVSSICGIPSAQGKYKAFSTCVSHLSVVSLFYGTSLEVYLSSAVTESSSATASVMYTVLTPMLNPFIYSLRNKDIKRALKRLVVILPPPHGTREPHRIFRISSSGIIRETRTAAPHIWLFLSMYLITVLGNLLIILAVSSDSHLHTPMYFFLSNLSLVDIGFTSTTVPKMLWNIQKQNRAITYEGCITQMYFFLLFAGLDNFLLTVMAYDRFVAICHPLHYMVIMNPRLLDCWFWDLEIPHFFCEIKQMVLLACSDTFLNTMVMYFGAGLLGGGPFVGILYSYSKIVSSIWGIPSAQGKYKAFSTCLSHLLVVSLFYGTSLGVYLSSAVTHSSYSSATASVMYTVVTPMLNPFIYSLRNKDIKRALKRFLGMLWGNW